MRAVIVALVTVLMLALAAVPVRAATLRPFTAVLNGPQEVPPNPSPAFGVAFLTFHDTTAQLCYAISYTALAAPETVAHFHGPAAPGEAAGVLLDISPSPSPLGSPKTGCVGPLDSVQQGYLTDGLLYINIHSETSPGGEIRGQVLRVIGVKYTVEDEG
jgi:hypothetical protein